MKEHIKLFIITSVMTCIAILTMTFFYDFTSIAITNLIAYSGTKSRTLIEAIFFIEYLTVSLVVSFPFAYIICKKISIKSSLLIIFTLSYCLATYIVWFAISSGFFDIFWVLSNILVQVFLASLLTCMLFLIYKPKVDALYSNVKFMIHSRATLKK